MPENSPLDDMDLPQSHSNEELETLSRRALEELFPVDLFELRSERQDKGIDYDVEIKHNGKYTNLRFLIQLKAHHLFEPNKDGSVSHSIRTSNIEYLLNGGIPAYYILYGKETQSLLYQELNEFVRSLMEKNKSWNTQAHHTIRFTKILDSQAIQEIYGNTINKGMFLREVSEKFIQASYVLHDSSRFSFDQSLKVTGDAEIKELIEKHGLDLINDGKWKEVLSLHQNATGKIITSPIYDLTIGLAYYYAGQFYLALNHLQQSYRKKEILLSDLQNHLLYFLELTKLSLGFTTPEDFTDFLQEMEQDSHIGLYIKIDKARHSFMHSNEGDYQKRYNQLEKEIQQVLSHSECTTGIELIARAELLYFEGQVNNVLYTQHVANINQIESEIGPNLDLRISLLKELLDRQETWKQNHIALLEKIRDLDNHFILHMTQLYYVKVMYENDLYTRNIKVQKTLPGQPVEPLSVKDEILNPLVSILESVVYFYNHSHFTENLIASMATLYELLHYQESYEKANKLMSQLEQLVDEKGSIENQQKIHHLKNQGTMHERFAATIGVDIARAKELQKEQDDLFDQLKELDEREKQKINSASEHEQYHIHLFPIGHFSFPKSDLKQVFSILKVTTEKAQENIAQMLDQEIVPVVNILQKEIQSEGYAQGRMEDKGKSSWLNIYRIRKAFFDRDYFRIDYPDMG